MNTEAGGIVVGDGACGGCAAVDEVEGDGVVVRDGLQQMLYQYGGVQKEIRCARVDVGFDGNRLLAGNQKVYQEGEVARERGRRKPYRPAGRDSVP